MSNLIKWSGSKSSQAKLICDYIPKDTINYYEPFLGGGSIFLELLENNNSIENYYLSDLNSELIGIYLLIKNNPEYIIESYSNHYDIFSKLDFEKRKKYFNSIRDLFNKNKTSEDLFWIMRTTTNGMPRYNLKQEFNNSCHFTRAGMDKNKVKVMINHYHNLFINNNVNFNSYSYDEIIFKNDSLIYLDPPYENTKGMYFSNFDNVKFINYINKLNCKWILSYDGKINDAKVDHINPNFVRHKYLLSGNSSFRRILGNKSSTIYESIYLNF